jgi:hypothetical protein
MGFFVCFCFLGYDIEHKSHNENNENKQQTITKLQKNQQKLQQIMVKNKKKYMIYNKFFF